MIRIATDKDLPVILDIHRLAFQEDDEAELVDALLQDPTAQPCLSLICVQENQAIGHVLFTKSMIEGTDLNAYLLAPLAVHPDFHYKGTGQRLMKEGFKILKEWGVDLIFVLGPPDYYPRVGFNHNAGAAGYPTPHPIPQQWTDAWMYIKLHDCVETGPVRVADKISAAEYWSD